MMKKLSLTAAFIGAALSATSAQALSVWFNGGAAATNLGTTTIFEDFEDETAGTPTEGAIEIFNSSISGITARPAFGSTGNYLGVQANNTSSLSFTLPGVQVLSFVIGSLDWYNEVVLNFKSGGSRTLTGLEIITGNLADSGLPANGNQTSAATNGRVFYDMGGSDWITGVSLRSIGSNAFEVDNFSTAVPEPATWGMMILAAGMAGAALRRRRTQDAMA